MQNDLYAAAKARMEAPDDASFLIRDGEGCVMFSAPHCVKQWREGREKFAEPETGVLAEMLPYYQEELGLKVVTVTELMSLEGAGPDARLPGDTLEEETVQE